MDNFGINYISEDTLQHCYNYLQAEAYGIVKDRAGDLYCGINLNWNYAKGYADLSMLTYVMKQLTRYSHPMSNQTPTLPFCTKPNYIQQE